MRSRLSSRSLRRMPAQWRRDRGRSPRRGSPRRGRPRPCRGRAARARLPLRLRLALWALPPDLSVTSRTIVISPHRDGDMGNRATRASRLSMPLALRFFLLSALCGFVLAAPARGQTTPEAQIGPRPFYLVEKMKDGPLKTQLSQCTGPFRKTDFSIAHRGAPLQFAEHSRESYQAAARMGAGVIECD